MVLTASPIQCPLCTDEVKLLNEVERFFAEITRRRIRRGTFTSVADLERAIREYLDDHHSAAKPFVWTATADSIFAKLSKYNRANS